jgi:hypothetical protein
MRISAFTVAYPGNFAVPTPECPMALRPGGGLGAVNFYDFTLGPFQRDRSNNDLKQRRCVSAASFSGQRRGLRGGECR